MFNLIRASQIPLLHSKIKEQNPRLVPYCVIDGDSIRADLSTIRGQELMSVKAYEYEHDADEKVEAYIKKLSLYLDDEAA